MTRLEEIKALPDGTQLPEMHEMPYFADWVNHPVSKELLARLQNKRDELKARVERTRCPGCHREKPDADRADTQYMAGMADAFACVAQIIERGGPKVCDCPSG